MKHHDVVSRGSSAGGKRVRSRLEQMLEHDTITPEESEAGRRFAFVWNRGMIDRVGNPLAFMPRGGGDRHPGEALLDAVQDYRLAAAALDATDKEYRIKGSVSPSQMLLWCVHEDQSDLQIADRLQCTQRTAKRRIKGYLTFLAVYYADLDSERGRSTTAHTKNAALARFEPKDDRNKWVKS